MYELTLNDFDYEINGDNLIFKKILRRKGNDIKLLGKYIINGKDYVVNEIEEGAFMYEKIKNIEFPDTIEIIGKKAFYKNEIEKFVMPPKVTEIPDYCFYGCENLTDVALHDNIENIGIHSFSFSDIKKFICPPKVNEIHYCCFLGCKNLKILDLNNVNNISSNSFIPCYDCNVGQQLNIFYQNNKNIFIDNYDTLKKNGFIDGQINQILKGYKKLIFLNKLPIDTPIDIFRTIINNFDKHQEEFSDIINKLENKDITLNEKIKLYNKIDKFVNEKYLNNNDIEHTI